MRRRVVVLAAVSVAVVVAALAAQRTNAVWDLTANRTLTLTEQTEEIVGQLRGDVDVTVFLRRDDPARVDAISLLTRYRRLDRRISFEAVDPDDAPGEVRRLRVDPVFGGLAVRLGDRIEVAPTPTEQDVTAALARLLRGRSAGLCHAVGHGQPALDSPVSEGISRAAALLRDNGYGLTELDLLARHAGRQVPASCDAVIVVNPTAPLGEAADVLRRWLQSDGRLLLLTDPASDVDVNPIVAGLGLRVERGIVFETDPEAVFPGDPVSPIVRTYSASHPVVRRLPPTFFPGAQMVEVDDDHSVPGLTTSRLADTSPDSWLDLEPLGARFDEGADTEGPITVAAAADRSRLEGDRVVRSRAVVTGDVDFATNAFIAEAGNAKLLVQAVDWLTLDEELVVLSTHLPRDRPLRLTTARSSYALFLSAGVVPALFLVAGALVWAVRRAR